MWSKSVCIFFIKKWEGTRLGAFRLLYAGGEISRRMADYSAGAASTEASVGAASAAASTGASTDSSAGAACSL